MEDKKYDQLFENAVRFVWNVVQPWREVWFGIKSRSLPWTECLSTILLLQFCLAAHIDRFFWGKLSLLRMYPTNIRPFLIYYGLFCLTPFYVWGLVRLFSSQRLTKRLTEAFGAAGLSNFTGKFPKLISDIPLDNSVRKLRLNRIGLPLEKFQEKKSAIESALHVFIDELREDRGAGTVDIIYSHTPMPDKFIVQEYGKLAATRFVIGTTRSKEIVVDLDNVPHLLIAGQTGGGKSTILRHLITSLVLNNRGTRFSLIDLKGGLEFQIFEKIKNIVVETETKRSIIGLQHLEQLMTERFNLLRANECKDIVQFGKKEGGKKLHREVVVVDEAAELFLSSSYAGAAEIRKAKEILSKIARQGRSLGVHLVIATQRPDARALDPQIKANLTGALCFQMVNDTSSISVLGNGRATDLPHIPGRGIWKTGLDMMEIQTPLLESSRAESLLESLREAEVNKPKVEVKPATEKAERPKK